MKYLKYFVSVIVLLCFVACQSGNNQGQVSKNTDISANTDAKEKLNIVTTFYPVYYMTSEIVGDKADVTMLLDGSVEPHDFEPSAKDIAMIAEANAFIYSNPSMETWAEQVESGLGKEKTVSFINSGKDVVLLEGDDDHDHDESDRHDEHGHHHDLDPHIWLDPFTAKSQVKTIAAALIQLDPTNASYYETNAEHLVQKLDKLVADYRASFDKALNKDFVTQHAAFGYIAKTFDLDQIAISSLQATEPTPRAIAEVIEEMKEHGLTVIYVDPNSSTAVAEAVARETGATIEYLYTLETSVSNKDYLEVLAENLKALQKSIK